MRNQIDNPPTLRFVFLLIWVVFTLALPKQTNGQSFAGNELAQANADNQKLLTLYGQGEYESAAKLGERIREVRQRILGKEHPDYAASVNNLAAIYVGMGAFARAEPLYLETIKIKEKTQGKANPSYATSLNNLAALYLEMGAHERAAPFFLESKQIRGKVLGKKHPDYATSLNNLAELYRQMGAFARAEPFYLESINIKEKVLGKAHPDYADSLNNLALLYDKTGSYERAELLLLQAKDIYGKTLGEEHPNYANSLNSIGAIYVSMGSPERAEPFFLEAKNIRGKVLGNEHPDYATSLFNLANLYKSFGSNERAKQLYLHAKKIRKKALGVEHPDYAANLKELAGLYSNMGWYEGAEPLYVEAKKIEKKVLGKDHPSYATSLNNLATLYLKQGSFKRAEPLLLESKKIREAVLGKEHPEYATTLNNLAELYKRWGLYAQAEPLYLEATQITEKVSGKAHPSYAITQNNLAALRFIIGESKSAYTNLDQARRSAHLYVTRLLPSLSQKRQQQFLRVSYRDEFMRSISAGLEFSDDAHFSNQSVNWVLNGKAIGHEALAFRNLTTQDAGNVSNRDHQQWTESKDVQNVIPIQTAVIEIVKFKEFDYRTRKSRGWRSDRYAAWIITRDEDVQVIDLGRAEAIEKLLQQIRAELQNPTDALESSGEEQAVQKLQVNMQALSEKIWQPIAKELGEIENVVLSPDGMLWLAPWSALPLGEDTEGETPYLIEKYNLRLVTSARDLLRTPDTRPTKKPVVFANPSFSQPADEKRDSIQRIFKKLPSEDKSSSRSISAKSLLPQVQPLPNTGVEADAIKPKIQAYTSTEPILYKERWALEHAVKKLKSPKIAAFATHGFFLPEQEVEPIDNRFVNTDNRRSVVLDKNNKPLENPLLRCGLLLAGCNDRNSVVGDDDGILTGMEITGIDFRGTELVVLSACDTGVGDIRNGEGVAGLRQAFQLAGAQSVVSSLWQVEDGETARLMKLFFQNLADGKSKSEALRQAQLTRIKARRARHGAAHPFFWAAFTLTGQD